MMKVLFFKEPDFWSEKIEQSGVTVIPLFKKIPFFFKPARIFHLNSHLRFKRIWYRRWEKQLDDYDLLILTAADFSVNIANYIDTLNVKKELRLIFWYWDPVRLKYSPDKVSERWEKWSFDKSDCKRYNLKYNSTYFFDSITLPPQKLVYDVFFVGQNKGRLNTLLNLKKTLEQFSLRILFLIISDKNFFYDKKVFQKRIPYKTTLKLISKSKSLLEFVQQNQSGPTLRSMEALFFDKKLITNNSSIKDYDFYCKENIFIIGEDDINEIFRFLNAPYKLVATEVTEQYNFIEWLKRLVNNVSLSL